MKIINLTPHTIVVRREDGTDVSFPASGTIARVATKVDDLGEFDGIPLTRQEFGKPEGIPDAQDDTIYLVSSLVASHAHRRDVYAPLTDKTAIRDENGQIVAVRGFQRIA